MIHVFVAIPALCEAAVHLEAVGVYAGTLGHELSEGLEYGTPVELLWKHLHTHLPLGAGEYTHNGQLVGRDRSDEQIPLELYPTNNSLQDGPQPSHILRQESLLPNEGLHRGLCSRA